MKVCLRRVQVIHGPNLNLLGRREAELYGRMSLAEIDERLVACAAEAGMELRIVQSNHQGVIVGAIHRAAGWADGLVINPGAYAHTSVAIGHALRSTLCLRTGQAASAVAAVELPAVEVHLSDIAAREPFRQASFIVPACTGQISGFGWQSYVLGLEAVVMVLKRGAPSRVRGEARHSPSRRCVGRSPTATGRRLALELLASCAAGRPSSH